MIRAVDHRRRRSSRRSWSKGYRSFLFFVIFSVLLLLSSHRLCNFVLQSANSLGRRCLEKSPETKSRSKPAPKVAMVSFSDEGDGKGRSFRGVMEVVRSNKMNYAAEWGYHFHDASDVVDRRRPASWSKILAVQRHLPGYDWIFWNDADSVVTNSSISLESVLRAVIGDVELDDSPDLVFTEDVNGVNAGMFFVRRSKWSEGFLKTWWNQTDYVRFGSTKSGDNDALKHLLGKLPAAERRHRVRVSPMQCLFNSYPWEFNWKSLFRLLRSPRSFWRGAYSRGDFMVHLAGLDDKREWAIKILKEI